MAPGLTEPNPMTLMSGFADRTGLTSSGNPPRRYLWTDAFAVCNFLEIFRRTGDESCRDLAFRLIDQVHRVLGRHRRDDSRRGWISGLDEEEGDRRPTAGGLRIGKTGKERPPEESLDESLEWARDGQYFHYLTKWMHALHQASRATVDPICLRWAVELAKTALAAFTYEPALGSRKRMYWKMRIDLSAPLVPAMGQHDPLDGLITYSQLQAAARQSNLPGEGSLSAEIDELSAICRGIDWITEDPLGIGGLLFDSCRVAQLLKRRAFENVELLSALLESALTSLEICNRSAPWRLPALYRLPFRELGLAIGLKGLNIISRLANGEPAAFDPKLPDTLHRFRGYLPLAEKIERFWLVEANWEFSGWQDHLDINEVMLATSLAPEGFLEI